MARVLWQMLVLVLPLGLDTFAMSAAVGLRGLPEQQRLRVALTFCAVEAAMPLVGLALGVPIGKAIGSGADYVGIALLIGLGLNGLFADDDAMTQPLRMDTRAAALLALTVSVDELALGFSFGLLRVPLVPVLVLIAAQAFLLARLGFRVGGSVGGRFREAAERLAGCALTGTGLLLLAETLVAG